MTYSQESRRGKYLCPKVATLPLSTRTSKLPALNCLCSSRVSLWGEMSIGRPSSTNSWTSWKMSSLLPVSKARRPKILRPVHTLIIWAANSLQKIVKLLRSQKDSKNQKRNIKNFLWSFQIPRLSFKRPNNNWENPKPTLFLNKLKFKRQILKKVICNQ
jgi:hypothetical protein